MDELLLADVVVPNTVEINETHVVALDLADVLAVVLDGSVEVVLGLAADVSEFKAGSEVVFDVLEVHSSYQLVAHGAHHEVVKVVVVVGESNLLAVLELEEFVAIGCEVGGVHASLCVVAGPPGKNVVLAGSLDHEVRDRRVVAGLLQVNQTAVLPHGFVSLTEDGVQGFLENFFEIKEGQSSNDSVFHLFDRILGMRGLVKVNSITAGHSRHDLQHRLMHHALDREANPC